MIQLTHLGRRTGWAQDDWLPVVAPSPMREPAHRSHPEGGRGLGHRAHRRQLRRRRRADAGRRAWTASRSRPTATSSTSSGRRSPTIATDEYGGSLENRLRFGWEVLQRHPGAGRRRLHRRAAHGRRRARAGRHRHRRPASRSSRRLEADRLIDFVNVIRGTSPATRRSPTSSRSTACRPHRTSTSPARCAARPAWPCFHAAQDRRRRHRPPRHPRGQGRHGRHDPRPHGRPAHRAQDHGGARGTRSGPASARPTASTASTRRRGAVHPQRRHRPRADDAARHPAGERVRGGSWWSAPGPAGWRRRAWRASGATDVTVLEAMPWAGGQIRLAARNPRRRDLMGIVEWRVAELERLGVDVRYDMLRRRSRRRSRSSPTSSIVATGGLPQLPELEDGDDLVVTSWDVLGGDVDADAATCCSSTTTAPTRPCPRPSSSPAPAPGWRSSRRSGCSASRSAA